MNKQEKVKLRSLNIFKDLSDENFQDLIKRLEEVRVPGNTYIFEAGDEGDCLYIIIEGEVQVYLEATENHPKVILSALGQGDYFGEMALLTGDPRSASVETIKECSLLRLEKSDFEKMIEHNPAISLVLSRSLSQRLKDANLKRIEAESQYISKMKPKGNLSEFPIVDILKFCEQNSLTGLLKLQNADDKADLEFLKGQLQRITFKDLEEDKAMDEILKWQEGDFLLEPQFPAIAVKGEDGQKSQNKKQTEPRKPEQVESTPVLATVAEAKIKEKVKNRHTNAIAGEPVKKFSETLLNKLSTAVGSRILQDVINKSFDSLKPYFPELMELKINISKDVVVHINEKSELSDRELLSTAVFLQVVLENCKKHLIGMSYLTPEKIADKDYKKLKELSLFDYMTHAKEFVTV